MELLGSFSLLLKKKRRGVVMRRNFVPSGQDFSVFRAAALLFDQRVVSLRTKPTC